MNFISERESLASNFAHETENNSSLLSSRLHHDEGIETDLLDFQAQINYKFIRSIANKTYTYPLSEEAYQLLNDEEQLAELVAVQKYNLYEQSEGKKTVDKGFKKQQFKLKSQENRQSPHKATNNFTSKTANLLLSTLQAEVLRTNNLRTYIDQHLKPKGIARPLERDFRAIEQEPEGESHRRRRLQTEPYEKPMGFIIKKK